MRSAREMAIAANEALAELGKRIYREGIVLLAEITAVPRDGNLGGHTFWHGTFCAEVEGKQVELRDVRITEPETLNARPGEQLKVTDLTVRPDKIVIHEVGRWQ